MNIFLCRNSCPLIGEAVQKIPACKAAEAIFYSRQEFLKSVDALLLKRGGVFSPSN
jgi:hypothetical protein